jgi:hypothetical protein
MKINGYFEENIASIFRIETNQETSMKKATAEILLVVCSMSLSYINCIAFMP